MRVGGGGALTAAASVAACVLATAVCAWAAPTAAGPAARYEDLKWYFNPKEAAPEAAQQGVRATCVLPHFGPEQAAQQLHAADGDKANSSSGAGSGNTVQWAPADETERLLCLRFFLTQVNELCGAASAMCTALSLYAEGTISTPQCHFVGHVVGEQAYRAERKKVVTTRQAATPADARLEGASNAFQACPSVCQQGCKHGCIIEYVRDVRAHAPSPHDGAVGGANATMGMTAEAAQEAANVEGLLRIMEICDRQPLAGGWEIFVQHMQCIHAVGHALGAEGELPQALAVQVCIQGTKDATERRACLEGVTMQVALEAVAVPEERLEERLNTACEGVRDLRMSGYDVERECVEAIGRQLIFLYGPDKPRAEGCCRRKFHTARHADWCATGVEQGLGLSEGMGQEEQSRLLSHKGPCHRPRLRCSTGGRARRQQHATNSNSHRPATN